MRASEVPATPATSGAVASARPLPAWPVLCLLWGVLGWWALGLLPFAPIIVAVPMVVLLAYRRGVRLVPGILPWWGFVAWTVPTVLMLDSVGRMIGWSIRVAQFAAIAVILLYVVNATERLTPRRLLDACTLMWLSFIAGGYLGLLWPEGQLTLTIGRLLPGSIRNNEYVQDLVFPTFAEIQNPWGAEEPFLRPAAPFAYTNGWGAGLAVLTPLVIAGVLHARSRRRIWLVAVAGVAAAAPVAASTNRGLLLGLVCVVGYVLVRQTLRGHGKASLVVLAVGGAAAGILGRAGLFDGITGRQDTVDTTDGRADLYRETFERTLASPFLGWGAPRPSLVQEVPVGTQGAIWNTMFCFGFIGLALYLAFIVGVIVRTWRAPTPVLLWMHASALSVLVMSAFYGLDRHLVVFAVVAGVLLRERYDRGSTFWPHPARAPRIRT